MTPFSKIQNEQHLKKCFFIHKVYHAYAVFMLIGFRDICFSSEEMSSLEKETCERFRIAT